MMEVRIGTRVVPAVKAALEQRAKDDDRSESYIIRQAIIAYLSKAPLDIGGPTNDVTADHLWRAMLSCSHTIEGHQIVIKVSDSLPGNAASQTFERLRAVLEQGK